MIGQPVGPIQFIPGKNQGRYPCCNSVYIEEAGILIDPASDRKTLIELRDTRGVRQVWLSHWHEDHFMHLDLFEDIPFRISERDLPPLTGIETFLDWYAMDNPEYRAFWAAMIKDQFHYQVRTPAGFLQGWRNHRSGFLDRRSHPHPGPYPRPPGLLFPGTENPVYGRLRPHGFRSLVWRFVFRHRSDHRIHQPPEKHSGRYLADRS